MVKILNVFVIFLWALSHSGLTQSNGARDEIYKMLAACDNLKTSSFNLISNERLKDGVYHESEILVKLQRDPKNVYVYCVNPNPGAECLWRVGEINNLLLINPNGFPFFNLKLNTHNALLRNGEHHTIEEIGFDYIAEVFRHYIRQEGDKIFNLFSLNGTAEYDGHQCKVLQYESPEFTYENYSVLERENLTSIAYTNYISDYMLLAANKLKNYNSVKPGQVIKLPRSEEHTSELQSLTNLVCRLLLEKKKETIRKTHLCGP